MTMPWSNQAVSLIVLLTSTGNFTGLFMYNGAPAAGNLIDSIAPSAGTDPQGNTYLQDMASYSAGGNYSQLSGGSVILGSLPATVDAQLVPFTGGMQMRVGVIAATDPASVVHAAETWHSLGTVTTTGLTVNRGRYRLTAEGEAEFDLNLTATGATANQSGTFSTTLAAAYRPAIDREYPMACTSDQNTGNHSARVHISAAGAVSIFVPPMAASGIFGGTCRMPLD